MSYQFVEDHREYIKREYDQRLIRRPMYSQRAMARDLGLSASTLTDYLKDRLALSPGRIVQLSKILGLSKEQTNHWVDLVQARFSRSEEKKQEAIISINARIKTEKNTISIDEFKMISEWQHLAFLELIQMNAVKFSDIKVSAKKLGLPVKEMKMVIRRLSQLNLLRKNQHNIFEVDFETYVGNEAPSAAIRFFHSQILEKAQKSLEVDDPDRRYSSSSMISIKKSQIPILIKYLEKSPTLLMDKYIKENQNQPTDELYCLTIHFFSLLDEKNR